MRVNDEVVALFQRRTSQRVRLCKKLLFISHVKMVKIEWLEVSKALKSAKIEVVPYENHL